jgi:hypothetical protein
MVEHVMTETGHFQVTWAYDTYKRGRPSHETPLKIRVLELRKGRKKEIIVYRYIEGGVRCHELLNKAFALAAKLEKLWPCHPLAKEYPTD